MTTHVRRVRNDLFVDNVDFKRVAREYLGADPTPPKDLNEAMERVARWFGQTNLQALNAACETPPPAAAATPHAAPAASGTSPYRVHPLVVTGKATPNAQQLVAVEGLVDALNAAMLHISQHRVMLLDSDDAWEMLQLDGLERLVWETRALYAALDGLPAIKLLQRYLLSLPGYTKDRYHDQRIETAQAHREVASLVAVAPDGWRSYGVSPIKYSGSPMLNDDKEALLSLGSIQER